MATIIQLKKKEATLRGELRDVLDEINDQTEKTELPKLRAKYKGKYFKFRNSYGGNSPQWWIYIRVDDVTSNTRATTFEFQSILNDKGMIEKVEIDWQTWRGFELLSVPCSKKEFDREYAAVLTLLQSETNN